MPVRQRFFLALLVAALAASVAGFPGPIHARATIVIRVLDGPGEGFNDPVAPDAASTAGGNTGATLGDQRFAAFAYAADKWAGLLDSSEPIIVGVAFDPQSCGADSASLGAAGTNTVHRDFTGAPVANVWYPAALANSLAGVDLAPVDDDINASFNSAIDGSTCTFPKVWYYGLDGNPPANTIDFVSIALHELGHGLGFQTFIDLSTGAKLNGLDDVFMLWLEDHSTGALYTAMNDADRVAASINTGNLHWVGPDVIAESGGLSSGRHPSGHVEMYAPDPPMDGSSVSHFSTSLIPNQLMEPAFTGATHDVGLAAAVMQDIGWLTTLQPTSATGPGSNAQASDGGGSGCFITTASNGAYR
jgi:hypothetical protein